MVDYNKMKGVLAFLKDNAYPYYLSEARGYDDKWQDDLYRAYLHSLTKDMLFQLLQKWQMDDACPSALYYKVKGILKSKEREEMSAISTSTLLEWHSNKKSGKVSVAVKELMTRYRKESSKNQRLILKAFIMGGKKEMEWAGRHLRDHWDDALSSYVDIRWKDTHNPILGYVILRHFPDDYVLAEQETLAEATKYAYVCARLGKVPGFQMDDERLSTPDTLYVLAKWDMGKSEAINVSVLADAMLEEYFDEEDYISPIEIGLILWSLGKLGLTDLLVDIKPKLEKLQTRTRDFNLSEKDLLFSPGGFFPE